MQSPLLKRGLEIMSWSKHTPRSSNWFRRAHITQYHCDHCIALQLPLQLYITQRLETHWFVSSGLQKLQIIIIIIALVILEQLQTSLSFALQLFQRVVATAVLSSRPAQSVIGVEVLVNFYKHGIASKSNNFKHIVLHIVF